MLTGTVLLLRLHASISAIKERRGAMCRGNSSSPTSGKTFVKNAENGCALKTFGISWPSAWTSSSASRSPATGTRTTAPGRAMPGGAGGGTIAMRSRCRLRGSRWVGSTGGSVASDGLGSLEPIVKQTLPEAISADARAHGRPHLAEGASATQEPTRTRSQLTADAPQDLVKMPVSRSFHDKDQWPCEPLELPCTSCKGAAGARLTGQLPWLRQRPLCRT